MKRLLHGAAFAATVICHSTAGAQTIYTCGQGTVHRVEALSETITPETITTWSGADTAAASGTREGQSRRTFVVTVQLGDRLFVSESSGDPDGVLDPRQIEPGDLIDICITPTQMILERANQYDVARRLQPSDGRSPKGFALRRNEKTH